MSPREISREGRFAVLVDGHESFGFVKSVTGGTSRGNVVVDRLGPNTALRKRIASQTYDKFVVEAGMGAPDGFFQWISSSFKTGHVSRSGEVHACDLDGKSLSVREFIDAYIQKVTFPHLDAQANEAAFLTVKLSPNSVRSRKGHGKKVQAKPLPVGRMLNRSRFRVTLGGLPCDGVVQVGSLSWKMALADESIRAAEVPVGNPIEWTEISDLRLTISLADYQPWEQWIQEFLLDGTGKGEVDGSIELLSEDQDSLAKIELLGCGPLMLDVFANEANQEQVELFVVELYVNQVGFKA